MSAEQPSEPLTIGELAHRTCVATSALRYWEELGLLPVPARVAGQRRYPPSAVFLVGVILSLRDVGFTLREVKAFVASSSARDGWRELAQRKVTELDQRIAQAQVARAALAHAAAACPHEDILQCPNFASVVAARLAGSSLEESLAH